MVVKHEAFTFLYLVFSNSNNYLYREKRRKDNGKASLCLKIIARSTIFEAKEITIYSVLALGSVASARICG